ncbi:MAG: LuxR C-terminal-related transcriptional regulator [Labedaea sp.]
MPRLSPEFMTRPRLLSALESAAGSPVVVVCAPAGYGKTALLTDWVGSRDRLDTAWVSLDADDNDERRFWSAILCAFGQCAAVPAANPLHDLRIRAGNTQVDFLAELVDALDALPAPVRLVLDDFQDVVRAEPLRGIATLIRQHPAGLRLVLSTRFDPRLQLARLRLQGDLIRIGADELRFTVAETASLMRTTGVRIDEDRVRRLVEHTEGWAAAVRWAAVSLAAAEDVDAFLTDLDGDDRTVAGFLADEVLSHLPDGTPDLLRRISVCDAVTAGLATRLSGREDAGAVLDALERHTSLVTRVDDGGGSYRLQPLLRSYLCADLDLRQPDLATELHGIAARWFAGEKRIGEALDHAAAGPHRAEIVDLLRGPAIPLLLTGAEDPVRSALSRIGEDVVREDPGLELVSALAHVQGGELTVAATELDHLAGTPTGDGAVLEWLTVGHLALAQGRSPADTPAPGGPLAAQFATWAELDRSWRLVHRGARRGAASRALEAVRTARRDGLDYLVVHGLAALAVADGLGGDYPAMRTTCLEAVEVAARHDWRRSPWVADCRLLLAFDHLLRLDPAAAAAESHKARAVLPAGAPLLEALNQFIDGAISFDLGERREGSQVMRLARHRLAEFELTGVLAAALAVVEHHAALAVAESLHAKEVSLWARDRIGGTAELTLMLARTQLADGHDDLAATTLAGLRDQPVLVLLPTTPVDAYLLQTALALGSGRRTEALRTLDRALELAERARVIRPFALAEPRVQHLLIDQSGGFGQLDDFARTVRGRISQLDPPAAADTLTEREQVILRRLPSQRSLDEIAADLTVSINTVKTHVRAIYVKLGVNNRRSAVLVARKHGLA